MIIFQHYFTSPQGAQKSSGVATAVYRARPLPLEGAGGPHLAGGQLPTGCGQGELRGPSSDTVHRQVSQWRLVHAYTYSCAGKEIYHQCLNYYSHPCLHKIAV